MSNINAYYAYSYAQIHMCTHTDTHILIKILMRRNFDDHDDKDSNNLVVDFIGNALK